MAITQISEDLKAAADYLFDGATVPQNTTLDGNEVEIGGVQGALEVVIVAATDIVITDLKTVSVDLYGAAEEGGSYALVDNSYTVTAAGATTVAAGTELGRYLWGTDDPLFVRAKITTDDVAVTGTVDAYIRAVAR